jgi:hypothetical protein
LKTARVRPGRAIRVDNTLDAHAHIVACAAGACRANGSVGERGNAVVTAFRGAHVAVAGWDIGVVIDRDDIAYAIAGVDFAIAVDGIVGGRSRIRKSWNTNGHGARPVDARRVVGTIPAIVARHATAAAARTSAAAAAARTSAAAATARTSAARACRTTAAFATTAPLAFFEQRGLGNFRNLSARAEAQEQSPAENAHGDARRRRVDVLCVVSLSHDKPPLDG